MSERGSQIIVVAGLVAVAAFAVIGMVTVIDTVGRLLQGIPL